MPRLALHASLLVLAVALVALSRLDLRPQTAEAPAFLPVERTPAQLSSRGPRPSENSPFRRVSVPHTTIPDRPRKDVILYTVQSGDTVSDIAERFGISADTVMWSNGDLEDNPDLLSVDQVIVILPVSGVYHEVKNGDTLESIAKQYKVTVDAITGYEFGNLTPGEPLHEGQFVIVPGGSKPYIERSVRVYSGPVPEGARLGTGAFVWPTSGSVTQVFWEYHKAIDIGGPLGSPIVAADSGYVVTILDTSYGYGRCVIIDHGNGFQTVYAHLQTYYVRVGQSVGRGQPIGSRGSTGNSTGPHLHFELLKNGVLCNPQVYLPN